MNTQPFLLLGTGNRGQVILSGSDFERHKVISGITGSGKSTFLAWIALSLLRQGVGFSLIDPHSDLSRLILQLLMQTDFFSNKKSFEKLLFVDFNRTDAAIPFNILKQPYESHTIADNLLKAIHRSFISSTTTAALDTTFLSATYVLAQNKRPITDMQQFLLDASYRSKLLKHVPDPQVVQYLESKLAAEKANSQLIDSTLRRLFLLTFSPQLRNALGQVENKLNFAALMQSGTSVLYSLGGLDEESKRLLGCLLMVGYEQAFLSRASLAPDRRIPYHLMVDEFPLFSASGESFGVILDQVRKYSGSLILAHQTQQQTKGIAGSLGNAISIVMKASVDDSSTLAGRYYRGQQDEPTSLFAFTSSPSIFSGVRNTTEARMIFENLQRQQAIVSINGKAELITTPTLPSGKLDHKKLTELENAYARHLLTPMKDIGKDTASPRLYLVPQSQLLQRRTLEPATSSKPLTLFVGDLERDIQTALSTFHYLSLDQLTRLLGKKEGNKNYLRKKLTGMISDSAIGVTTLPRVTGGKPLQVFYLPGAGERKHQFLEHTLDVNEVLIAGVLLSTIVEGLTLVDVKSERTLKTLLATCPCIPDGLLTYQTKEGELINIALEIDRASENRDRVSEKYISSSVWIETLGIDALTLAFIVTTGDKKRVSWLMDIANEVNTDLADILLFGCAPGDILSPSLFTDQIFKGLDGSQHALLE
ncbi:MAG: helicase HerA domain-containing protein [Ktedonobacteraceae bacterium]